MEASPILQLVIIVVLLVLSSFFSSSETALTTVNKHKLRVLADDGSKRAARVLKVTENPGKLLSTILIGNNIVNIAASALTTTFCTEFFGNKYIGIGTGILTLLILIFGEISPKTLAKHYAVPFSMVVVYPIAGLMIILTPIIWILNLITNFIFWILRIDPNENTDAMTESELLTIVNVSEEEGVIEQEERQMISNVVDFGDALSKDVMIPRADVIFADVNSTYEELIAIFLEENYSRIPIYEDSKDNVIGLLYLKDLFYYSHTNDMNYFDLRSILRKPVFVYEYQKTSQIFSDMKTSSVTMAVVLDEYGVASGIITMEDLIEEIVGEIRDEYDESENDLIISLDDMKYSIDGSIKLTDLNDALGTSFESEDYDSLAGYVIELMDKLPSEGESIENDVAHFRVMSVHKNRIERIELTIFPKEEPETEE